MQGKETRRVAPVLVLSTGRCGSTMISDMVNRHPEVLSLSEFFSFILSSAFSRKRLDGRAMWEICRRQAPGLHALLTGGDIISEIIYPFDAPGTRFSPRDVPPILCTTLPHLTPRFESLYDELEAAVRARPEAQLADQYRFLFEWLRERLERRVWIERSGGSLVYGFRLLKLFPDARVVHIYRDGRDTVMSMSRHHGFRMTLAAAQKLRRVGIPLMRTDKNPMDLPLIMPASRRFLAALFSRFVDFRKLMHQEFDLESYGELWSQMILGGQAYLSSLPADRFLALRYEDVLQRPREKLTELAEFIDPSLADDAWLDEAARIARPNPPKYPSLDPETRSRLARACAPGLAALGYPA